MKPTPEESERRQRLVAKIRARRIERVIAPLTTSGL